MFWKLEYKFLLQKGFTFILDQKKNTSIKNVNNYFSFKFKNYYILNFNEVIYLNYLLVFFLQGFIKKNGKILLVSNTFIEQSNLDFVISDKVLQNQFIRVGTKWFGGILSNFIVIRWFFLFNNSSFFHEVPSMVVSLEKQLGGGLFSEAFKLGIPIISYSEFSKKDSNSFYMFLGDISNSSKRLDSFFFFLFLLKQMILLERTLKKKLYVKNSVK